MRGALRPGTWHVPALRLLGLAATALASAAVAQDGAAPEAAEGIELRRPQTEPLKYPLPGIDPRQVPAPSRYDPRISLPVPDRWRIVESLGVKDRWWDPYNQNTIKGDRPYERLKAWGPDWFLNLGAVSDSLLESRRVPIPVGAQSSRRVAANDIFGRESQLALVETVILSASLLKGDTTFKPPDY